MIETLKDLYDGELTEEEWLHDLETTRAKQTTGKLGTHEIGFCCLGRACVKDKRIKLRYGEPPFFDATRHRAITRVLNGLEVTGNGTVGGGPFEFIPAWSWATKEDLVLATRANDKYGFTFKEIAAWWRAGRPVDRYGHPINQLEVGNK